MCKEAREHVWTNVDDLECIYSELNGGSEKGKRKFIAKAKNLKCARMFRGAYIFKDEDELFKLFQQEMPEQLAKRKIRYGYGDLMQYVYGLR